VLFATRAGSTDVVVADVRRHTTRTLGPGTDVALSEDGTRLAVVNHCALRVASLTGSARADVPRPAAACDSLPGWSKGDSLLVFTRSQNETKTVLAVAADGSGQRTLAPVPASEVVWPAHCAGAGLYRYDWLLPDRAGVPQLVEPPQLPPDSAAAWRCW
jgi:hypothetical protein